LPQTTHQPLRLQLLVYRGSTAPACQGTQSPKSLPQHPGFCVRSGGGLSQCSYTTLFCRLRSPHHDFKDSDIGHPRNCQDAGRHATRLFRRYYNQYPVVKLLRCHGVSFAKTTDSAVWLANTLAVLFQTMPSPLRDLLEANHHTPFRPTHLDRYQLLESGLLSRVLASFPHLGARLPNGHEFKKKATIRTYLVT
jgi:hypothetical protein